eukprot:TRINITY_DN30934_c0_g1_i1.p1 TRINITY_DN30934_c0_g1~~TRINITY_DN30934_c0_g1_i1.p1  ORF type:complete len:330 (+),score=125.99 TRINITY_DN30934_c0_g1_i1:35-991(+)
MHAVLVILLLSSVGGLAAPLPKLFGIITEVVDDDTSTAVFSISIDPSNGSIKNVSENFFFAGSSATVDGISALDQSNGVYFYASDSEDAFIYQVNVFQGQLLAPIDIGAKGIFHFTADSARNRFLTVAEDASSGNVNLLQTDATNSKTIMLTQLPPAVNNEIISTATIEPSTGNYLLVAATSANTSRPDYKVFTFSPSGSLLSTSPAIAVDGFFLRVAWDTPSLQLVGLLEQWTDDKLSYAVISVQPKTGAAHVTPVKSIVQGIVTSVTYSKADRTLYFCEARNAVGGVLHRWNVAGGNETSVMLQDGYVLESFEATA